VFDSVFQDGEQGYYVNPGDENDLSEKIQTILSNDQLREKMAKNSRELVENKYSWENSIKKLEKIINNI
jgi:glycosyltransferase involved in cell wall biosynthesis